MNDITTTDVILDLDRAPITSLADELTRLEVEDAIMQLEGVESARIVAGTTRIVDELHALVSLEREPKHVARDLQTLLLTRFGIEVDRRVISVVRLGSKAVVDLGAGMPRLTLDCVNVAVRSSDTSVSVELLDADGNGVLGSAGPIPGDAVVLATAQATADALNTVLGPGAVRVLDAQLINGGGQRMALVAIEVQDSRSRQVLTGSALVRRNEADSLARAVLDATNRLDQA